MIFQTRWLLLLALGIMLPVALWAQNTFQATASFLGTHEYERVGYHIHKAGDVNGDGYDDFLIGAFHNNASGYNSGAAYLILGRAAADWGQNVSLTQADARFIGSKAYEAAGYYLGGGGNLNGDQYEDFLIGADDGYLFVILGKASANWGYNCVLTQNADASYVEENAEDAAGDANAIIGDLNGDGYDEIICGAPYNDYGASDAGKAYLILGKASGWMRDVNLSQADASFYGHNENGLVGYSVDGVGDVNGDGVPDFAIGARGEGKIYLFFGRKNVNWGRNCDIDRADVVIRAEYSGDYVGWRVSRAGDVNNDGYDDIIIGAPYNDSNGPESGKAYLVLGRSSGWRTNLADADASFIGEASNDQAGWDVQEAGDFDQDGYDDFLVGAWYNDANGTDAGKMYLIKGKASGWQRDVSLSTIPDYFLGEHAGDYAGYSVATAGDVNHDGLPDLMTSATYYSEVYHWGGKIYLFVNQSGPTPAISISSPNGGENWEGGSVHNIQWTSQGTSGNVKLEYSTNNGSTWQEIVASTADDGSYAWTIPNQPSTNCLVKITDTDGSPSDVSDATFTISQSPFITVISPNGGENWQVGSVQNVTWNSSGTSGNVKLEYSTNNGSTWQEIVASTADDGSYAWTIPNQPSTTCLVKITDTDGSPSDVSDATFTISQSPFITVISPNGGESWQVGSVQNITWNSSGTSGNVKLEYSTNNGATWQEIVASTTDDGSYAWTVPNQPSTTCLVRITDTDGSPSDVSDATFNISQSPFITVSSPNGGENWQVGSVQNVTWNSSGTSGNVKLEYSTNNGATWQEIVASTADDGSYAWTIPNDPSTNCLVKITDTDGSPTDVSNTTFIISQADFITVNAPNGGEVWLIGTVQNISWSSSLTSGNVRIDYSTDNGGLWKSVITSTPDDGSYDWSIPNDPSTNCLVRITDVDGSPSDQSNGVFSISTESCNLTMAVSPSNCGSTEPPVGTHVYAGGSTVNIAASPTAGYIFDHWTGGVTDSLAAATTVVMNGDKKVTAYFVLKPITDSRASIQGQNILLEWTASETPALYNVYRDTSYNFVPDVTNGTNRIGQFVYDQDSNRPGIQWTDTGNGADIVGDVSKNYYYKITVYNGMESAPSNVAGEFDYQLTTTSGTDINEIVLIMDTRNSSAPITTAEQLAQAIPNCSDVYYWGAEGQGTVGHVKGLPFNDFPVYPGYPYIVNVTANTVWSLAGSCVDTSFSLVTTEGTDINHIGVPLSKGSLTTAEQLGQDIPGCTDVYRWGADGQGTIGHVVGLPFNDFAVRAGYPYYVNVTAATVWPEGGSSLAKAPIAGSAVQPRPGRGAPHTVYGQIGVGDGQELHTKEWQINAWITCRPAEVLTQATAGVGCDGSYWWVGVSNFATQWAEGESLYVEIIAPDLGLLGQTMVALTTAGSDNGGTVQLVKPESARMAQGDGRRQEFALLPNYPNPFNPETCIAYSLPKASPVVVKIYNLLGKEIRMLVNQNQPAGYHRVIWDGKDAASSEVPSGIYLLQIQASDFKMNRKMVKVE